MHTSRKAGPLLGLASLTALGLSATLAAAQTTVFSTLGPGNSFNNGTQYSESGPTSATPALRKISEGRRGHRLQAAT